jgi:hypothetical protein
MSFTLKCFDGTKHGGNFLTTIYVSGTDEEAASVKWCSVCGAVVVDTEIDGHRMGTVVDMKFPTTVNLRSNK